MLSRILEEGHCLGNHTFSHPLEGRIGYKDYLSDLGKCQEIVFEHTGTRPRFHRPPGGTLSLATLLAPKHHRLVTLNWSRSAEDWRFRSDAEAIARTSAMAAEVKSRDILLFHDERQESVVALEHLLPVLKDRGFGMAPDLSRVI